MHTIKVLIVEDDIYWQKGIMALLNKQTDISIVGVASNKDDAIHLLNSINADIILLDIKIDDNLAEGVYIAAEISDISRAKIIMLTSYDTDEMIIKSFTAGASNFISKSNFKSIPGIIREAFYNSTPIEVLAKNQVKLQKELYLKSLTISERDIYDLYETGHKLTEIEYITKKSSNTIRNQVRNILSKLGAKNLKESAKRRQLINVKRDEC